MLMALRSGVGILCVRGSIATAVTNVEIKTARRLSVCL